MLSTNKKKSSLSVCLLFEPWSCRQNKSFQLYLSCKHEFGEAYGNRNNWNRNKEEENKNIDTIVLK